ncbi:Uncharacterised protein [Candidatus Ornithobacterium hominis]|uniref:Uncharacterized protein n=1 Tax=Candidatus Ornithobacterium hominis TaxID=2497989 RepID=A0A383U2H1_9FLAO|nr:hypothetical protein [Candidatus Ornithobacterium hominis]MCT7905041.1 hypothetical protein [Candidatus Ornithobacterium hominis]SZD73786.1 Uncharacterised protein [Candidatus Ornithobacterium hominis]SZD74122.1 Uncharacterised protein [Candidatus Ornithobacterium hominis]
MTYSTIVGLMLTVIGLFLFILQEPDYTYKEFYIATLLAGGIGLFLGGIMGYAQKKRKKVVDPKFTYREKDRMLKEEDSGLKL